jgi:hypothetical protein
MGAPILFFLGYFIVFITILTLLWRITIALDRIGDRLTDISKTLTDKKDK